MSDDDELVVSKVLRKRKGWQGEELEMEHHREKFRNSTIEGYSSTSNPVAMDLKQFQNHRVGEGYQAKHVVRQRTVTDSGIKIMDMSRKATKAEPMSRKATKAEPMSRKATKAEPMSRSSYDNDDDDDDLLPTYLRCRGIREFRRQLDEILKASS
jgi:hypothetical protein